MNHHGYGWFWRAIDEDRAMFVPLSTQYRTPPLRWRHTETCAVDRVSGLGCTCICTTTAAKEVNQHEGMPALR